MRPARRVAVAAAAWALGLLLGACGEAPPGSRPSDPGWMPTGLAGSWISTEVASPEFAGTDAQIRLTLSHEEVRFRADCNILFGTPVWTDGRLSVEQIGSTEMGCSPQRHRRDDWMTAFFADADRLELDGSVLVVRRGDDEVRFRPDEVVRPQPDGSPDDSVSSPAG